MSADIYLSEFTSAVEIPFGRFTHEGRTSSVHCTRGWLGFRVFVDAKAKGKIPALDENRSSSWSVTVMTDWLISLQFSSVFLNDTHQKEWRPVSGCNSTVSAFVFPLSIRGECSGVLPSYFLTIIINKCIFIATGQRIQQSTFTVKTVTVCQLIIECRMGEVVG